MVAFSDMYVKNFPQESDKKEKREGLVIGKVRYKVRNWPDYNRALKDRYRLELWLSAGRGKSWYAPTSPSALAEGIGGRRLNRCGRVKQRDTWLRL